MATLTLPPELSEMRIVLRMTGVTVARQVRFGWRLAMAIAADQFAVGAGECEASGLLMIKVPDTPAVG